MTLQIPNIDISNGLDTPELIEQLQDACEGWGFFQITGHGIDIELRQKFFSAMTAFFDLPKAKKLQLSRSEHNYWGYYDKELTKNKLDSKEIFDIDANLCRLGKLRSDHPVPWPNEIPQLQTIVIDWLQACEKLSQNLVAAICVAMGQASNTLSPFFGNQHSSFLRFNYYPSLAEISPSRDKSEQPGLGIHPHTDAGAITVLAQDDVAGLQVKKEDTWHTVYPAENSFIINIGDMMQVWSNDRFTAAEHRVLASVNQSRLSAPYFYNPSYATICSPLVSDEQSSHYKPISWNEFRNGRAAGDYADQGEEIQISRFRK
jgi:isopenicillin N synthase-like dioxygenase